MQNDGGQMVGSSGALVGAADWVQALMVGTIGFTVATLAIALLGVMMFTGRIPMRRAGQVVIGCFILFSAKVIAAGLAGASLGSAAATPQVPPQPAALAYQPQVPTLEQKDPYAGAAVPPPQEDEWK